jgi:hypothetical protein
VLPGIVASLARPLRPVAPHLHTAAERAALAALVAVLLGYALTFAPAGAGAGASGAAPRGAAPAEAAEEVNALAPPVHRLTLFAVRQPGLVPCRPDAWARQPALPQLPCAHAVALPPHRHLPFSGPVLRS